MRLEQWHELAKTGYLEQVLFEAYQLTNLELRSALIDQDDQELLNLRAVLNYTRRRDAAPAPWGSSTHQLVRRHHGRY